MTPSIQAQMPCIATTLGKRKGALPSITESEPLTVLAVVLGAHLLRVLQQPLPDPVVPETIEIIPGTGSLTLTWKEPSGNGNDVTHYNLRYARNVELVPWSSTRRVAASALPTYRITGLSSGPHIVEITAVNSVGSSTKATTGGRDSPAFAVAAPSSVTAVPAARENTLGDKITVKWSAVSNALGYRVEYIDTTEDPATAANWMAVDPQRNANLPCDPANTDDTDVDPNCKTIGGSNFFDARVREATVTGLPDISLHTTPVGTYVVRVRAVTQGTLGGQASGDPQLGNPGFSAPVKAENTPDTAPTQPAADAVVQVPKTTTLRVVWTPPADARAEGVTNYKVTWYPISSTVVGNRGSATVAGDAKSYDITGLTAIGERFTIEVAAVNEVGVGAPVTFTQPETAPLLPPSS